jgi:hypothetical protein
VNDEPLPWAQNPKAQAVLARLPATTTELQRDTRLLHVARQVWELRHWYGYDIRTRRLPGGVAYYSLSPLRSGQQLPVGKTPAGAVPVAASTRGVFGDVQLIRQMRRR